MNADEILARLEELLPVLIPRVVKRLQIKTPIYSLRIIFYGTDVMPEDRSTSLLLVKEAYRQSVLQTRGDMVPTYLWSTGEFDSLDGELGPIRANITDPEVASLVGAWFDAQPETELPSDGDLEPFHQMLQRVARKLNGLDWRPAAPVTEDFTVLPTDATFSLGVGDYDEMVACLPAKRIEEFRERGLLGRETWWTLGDPSTYGNDEV
jgi:hypothetical protein